MSQTTIAIDEEALRKYSFDLVHFPMYLDRSVAPRVRVEITAGHEQADLMGLYRDDQEVKSWKYVKLIADEHGCVTKSDEFFHTVHAAFAGSAGGSTYIGFTRAGLPVYAPLFALVSCVRNSQTKSPDAGEDVIGGLRPHERRGVGVVQVEVLMDGLLKLSG